MKTIQILFLFLFYSSGLVGQTNLGSGITKANICNISGKEEFVSDNTFNESFLVEKKDSLYRIIENISVNLYHRSNLGSKIILKRNSIQDAASAFARTEGDNTNGLYILLNDQKLRKHFEERSYQNALLIFVLAHELSHYNSGDVLQLGTTKYQNFDNELQADKEAGRAIGLLTDFNMDFFDLALSKILVDDTFSVTHPLTDYRVMAAKAGWLESKFTLSKDNAEIMVNGISYKKVHYNDGKGRLVLGKYDAASNSFNDFIYEISDTSSKAVEYYYASNSSKAGFVVTFFESTNKHSRLIHTSNSKDKTFDILNTSSYAWEGGSHFCGTFINKKNLTNRVGIFTAKNGDIKNGEMGDSYVLNGRGYYKAVSGDLRIGEWLNDQLEGFGVHIDQNGKVEKGVWKDGVLIKKE